jgi:hypothetical protein
VVNVIFGVLPSHRYGTGNGFGGYGEGTGYGTGTGYGYGAGYGEGDGYGTGYGEGTGYGTGTGYGEGDGYDGTGSGYGYGGYGEGTGYSYGTGTGYGSGYGYGGYDGTGYGTGIGYGTGYFPGYFPGHGNGDVYGDGSFKEAVQGFVSLLKAQTRKRVKQLLKEGARLAYWKSNADGTPANGGKSEPVYEGMVQKVQGPLDICTRRALHATYSPSKWKGDRLWLVALKGEIVGQEDKLAALEREIVAELTPKNVKVDLQ